MLKPLESALVRVSQAETDSPAQLFDELMLTGELLLKLSTIALACAVERDPERARYTHEYELVRADGLGFWVGTLGQILTGSSATLISSHAEPAHREWTQKFTRAADDWQAQATRDMHEALSIVKPETEALSKRYSLARAAGDFVTLRNATRGHGATTLEIKRRVIAPLGSAVRLMAGNVAVLNRWQAAYIRQNRSGKYLVQPLSDHASCFDYLKSEPGHRLTGGIYFAFDTPRRTDLLTFDEEAGDVFLPNGTVNSTAQYEALCYRTGLTRRESLAQFLDPPGAQPASSTSGSPELRSVGPILTNAPDRPKGYVARPNLETRLRDALLDDHHRVVTLVGRGGIGKTSLALTALHNIAEAERFFAIVWFSSRDIELLADNSQLVRPDVVSQKDIARSYVSLIAETDTIMTSSAAIATLESHMVDGYENEPVLFVFDNFETVERPLELYGWLEQHIRSPNKILVTTRERDFSADWPIPVSGMSEDEFAELVTSFARDRGVADLLDDEYVASLYQSADGHPYIGKVVVGHISLTRELVKMERVIETKERLLDHLFERTYNQLSPGAKRAFLTLGSWRSAVVEIVFVSVSVHSDLSSSDDAESAVDELVRSSLIERIPTDMGPQLDLLMVPTTASLFARRKLTASPFAAPVKANVSLLTKFGPIKSHADKAGVERQIVAFHGSVQRNEVSWGEATPILETVATFYPIAWLWLASMAVSRPMMPRFREEAERFYTRYLEQVPADSQAWLLLAGVRRDLGDEPGALQAEVNGALRPGAAFQDLSEAANRVNRAFFEASQGKATLEGYGPLEREELAKSLALRMDGRKTEGTPEDHSRLGWLWLNAHDEDRARTAAADGLALDPDNKHCQISLLSSVAAKSRQRYE